MAPGAPGVWAPKTTAILRAPAKMENVTWLGVSASGAAPALREQLKLPRGVGLVVDSVEDKGPAEEAGIKPLDVLEKLNDQWLINVEQFTALVRSMKVGDEVTLSVFRQGARQEVKAKLAEKEVEVGGGVGGITKYIFTPAAAAPTPVRFLTTPAANPPTALDVIRTDHGGLLMLDAVNGKQTTQWMDDQIEVDVERDGDKTNRVTVKDRKTGKVMLTGPATMDDAMFNKVRPDLADKIRKALDASKTMPMRADLVITEPTDVGVGVMVGGGGGGRGKVTKWQDGDFVLILRTSGGKPVYLLALSKKDGRTVYDGPVMTDEQREGVPAEVSEQFKIVAARPELATELGGGGGGAQPKK
jgi:hypothetical protein